MAIFRRLLCSFGCLTVCSILFFVACIVFWTSGGKVNTLLWAEMKKNPMSYMNLSSAENVSFTWRPFYSSIDRQSMPRQTGPGLTHSSFKPKCQLDAPCISMATRWFNYDSWHLYTDNFYPQNCPYQCNFVSDVSEADAVVFNGRDIFPKPVTWRRHPRQVWVYLNTESQHNTKIYGLDLSVNPVYYTMFNWTSTFQKDSFARLSYGEIEPRPVPVTPSLPSLQLKKRLAYMVFSNCRWIFNNRNTVVARLQTVMDLDLYGGCGKYSLPRSEDAFVQVAKKYYFYLSFENSLCQEYISEKFFSNGLSTDAVPVVIGGLSRKDYEEVAPPNSFVYALDFKTAKELAEYLRRLAADTKAYMAMFAWRATYQVRKENYLCGICRTLYKTMPKMLNPNAPKQMVSHLNSYYPVEKFCRPLDFAYLI